MVVAFISLMEGFPWGGSEELWYKSALYAQEQNHQVLFSSKFWGEKSSPKLESLVNNGALPFYRGKPAAKRSLFSRATRKAQKVIGLSTNKEEETWLWLSEHKPDVVCINMGGPFDVIRRGDLIKVLNQNNIPFVLIQQFNFEHHVLKDKARKIACDIFSNADKIFFVAERNRQVTERTLAIRLENAIQISNPVNLPNTDGVEYPSTNKDFNLAMVARLDVAYKGHDVLLSALSGAKWKNENWHLNLYGTGQDYNYISELINFYQLQDKVSLRGSVNDVQEIWRNNHALVLPSYAEGTPLSLIEAMVCGRTAIVTDVGGVSGLVDNNHSAFIAAYPSVALIDEALTNAWNRRFEWEAMGKTAREEVLKRINFGSHKDLLNELLETGQNGRSRKKP